MIDMHIHTHNSDGTDSVKELLEKAENLKLKYISITDHDTCRSYDEIKNTDYTNIFSGTIVKGIEMKVFYNGGTIEVVGYKINTEIMSQWLNDFYKDKSREVLQKKYFNLLYGKCKQMGLLLADKEKINWNPQKDWASFVIYTEIKNHLENRKKVPDDLWESFSGFNRKYCNDPKHILYIDKSDDYPSLPEAIHAIKKANGLVFMPHLYIYKWIKNKEQFINDLISNYEIDGIECYYTDFTEKQTQYLLDLCDRKGLYKSGGSDYHGENKPRISLAKGYGNLNISEKIIENWV